MKMLYVILFLFSLCHSLTANGAPKKPKDEINISGTIDEQQTSSVEMLLYDRYFSSRFYLDANITILKVSNGRFNIRLKNVKAPKYFILRIPGKGTFLNLSLIEPGDDIIIKVERKNILFSGPGSEKLTAQYKIQSAHIEAFKNLALKYKGQPKTKEYFISNKLAFDTAYTVKFRILDSFKSKMSSLSYEIIKADTYFENYNGFFSELFFYANRKSPQIFSDFYKECLSKWTENYSEFKTAIPYSAYMSDCIVQRLAIESKIRSLPKNEVSFKEVYQHIVSSFSGLLREKLLVSAYSRYHKKDTIAASLLPSALLLVENKDLRKILISMSGLELGKMAFNFNLKDSSGKEYTLESFKGNIVVLDFWIVGCPYCAALHQGLAKVKKELIDKPDIKFVTICVEENDQRWRMALRSKKFGIEGATHLVITEPNGIHPMIKHYNISGYPTLLIVDQEGKLIAIEPDRPIESEKTTQFIDFLKSKTKKEL